MKKSFITSGLVAWCLVIHVWLWLAVPRGCLSAVCDSGISWSYSLTIFHDDPDFNHTSIGLVPEACLWIQLVVVFSSRCPLVIVSSMFHQNQCLSYTHVQVKQVLFIVDKWEPVSISHSLTGKTGKPLNNLKTFINYYGQICLFLKAFPDV